MRKTLVTAAVVLATAGAALAQGRPATFDDVLNVKAVGGATISPDGKHVLYTCLLYTSPSPRDS